MLRCLSWWCGKADTGWWLLHQLQHTDVLFDLHGIPLKVGLHAEIPELENYIYIYIYAFSCKIRRSGKSNPMFPPATICWAWTGAVGRGQHMCLQVPHFLPDPLHSSQDLTGPWRHLNVWPLLLKVEDSLLSCPQISKECLPRYPSPWGESQVDDFNL